ncbi:MAG: hypothetical protein Q8P18_04460 [Pseudomonadota bacterium]|nr:hypothetical protein [Pseudomonadota bacterium]
MPNLSRLSLLAAVLLTGCPPTDDDSGSTADLRWWSTCGDPACADYDPARHTNPVCATEVEGDTCTPEGAGCDLEAACNVELVCATSDPTAGEVGCPISLRSAKTEIRYLDGPASQGLHDALMSVRLADYRYKTEPEGAKHHLGFIIDDQPAGSPAVLSSGGRVDLYGYTSMAVAALQVQEAQLAAQAAELAAQRAQIAALEARLGALEAGPSRTAARR